MKIHGIGIDVVEVERIGSSMAEFGERFSNRIFTAGERAYCEAQKRPEIHFAARFAAKEAIAKAFGKESGEPLLILSGTGKAFAEARGIAEVKISLTHARHYAAANAVALGE